MAKRQFDLSAMIDTVSKLDTNPGPRVQMIPLDDILASKANFYKVDKPTLKPLADSIAMDGLQQYPVVMPHPEQAGKYLLLSGHRRWGTAEDIKPYIDPKFDQNILLSQTERVMVGRNKNSKYNINKNVLVIGGSGSGKTRFHVKPNLMQMNASYIVTDPKGLIA